MPHARPMPSIGPGVLELRITDGSTNGEWRIVLKAERDVIAVLHFFQKKTQRRHSRFSISASSASLRSPKPGGRDGVSKEAQARSRRVAGR